MPLCCVHFHVRLEVRFDLQVVEDNPFHLDIETLPQGPQRSLTTAATDHRPPATAHLAAHDTSTR
jgi:hypothetical protein